MARKPAPPMVVETLTHDEATRKNIPTAEYQSMMRKDEQTPVRVTYARGPAEQPDALTGEKAAQPRPRPAAHLARQGPTQNWSNRMVLGDSLQVMASLAEREGLRGKVQCIYMTRPTASNSTATSNGVPPAAM